MKKGKIIGAVCALAASVLTVSSLFAYSFITTTQPGSTVSHVQKTAAANTVTAAQVTKAENTAKKETKAIAQKAVTPAPKTKETKEAAKKEAPKKEAPKKETAKKETPAEKKAVDNDEILGYAREALKKCTDSSMSKEEKLKKAFKYLQNNYLEGIVRPTYTGNDWAKVYAKDLFVGGKGDCFSYGAAFAYMAKAIGYTESYACNSGGHGWAEINGKIYDPEWSMHSRQHSYFGMSYDEPCDVAYKGAIGWADWTHVKV